MKKLKIFLTGSEGFIGRNLQEQLAGKYEFTTLGHRELDLTDAAKISNFLKTGKFDLVIHAASIGGKRTTQPISDVFEINKKMFLNLADNRQYFGRMIFFGSGAEYGKQREIVRIKETDFGKIKPEDEYGRAKYFASEFIGSTDNIINLRLFGVYGKYEDYAIRFISNTICRMLLGLPSIIRQNVKFDYLYVKDLVRIVEYFMNTEAKEKFYNVGRGEEIELLALAKIIKTLTGADSEIQIKHPGMGLEYTCDTALLMHELPGFKFTSMEQAIAEMVTWFKHNWNAIDKNKLNFDV